MSSSGSTAHAAASDIATPDSAWRPRRDAWEHLGYAITELAQCDVGMPRPGLTAEIDRLIAVLRSTEPFWAVPGAETVETIAALIAEDRVHDALEVTAAAGDRVRARISPGHAVPTPPDADEADSGTALPAPGSGTLVKTPFEVLVLDDGPADELARFRSDLAEQRRTGESFGYDINVLSAVEDVLAALVVNPGIQAVVITPRFAVPSRRRLSASLRSFIAARIGDRLDGGHAFERIRSLADIISALRPELDLYLVAGVALESLAGSLTGTFRRIFSRGDLLELHLSILGGVAERYETPFFAALQEHALRPGSVFHALPISRGGSVQHSPWIHDMADFYGSNLLLAETSATSGGLDSLLAPHGSIKEAQERAARAFRSHRTYFVTNGTSTANKIVHQSIVAPGDIVLVDRNCHKSHHYALVAAGASVSYLDAYPLDEHSIVGAVPIQAIKQRLLDLERAGHLHRVKMLALTNCTFDGIVYDVRRVVEECLAIKPDLVFLWDEAWFAFAAFHPVYRQRTAMFTAAAIQSARDDREWARRHAEQSQRFAALDDDARHRARLAERLVPDPARIRVRMYATQSTHKTLTALRQGSMIHVFDEEFASRNEDAFREAFMTHTSTSPNYQILASLDIGRRQVELEGYGLVQRQADLAHSVSRAVARHPLLRRYFRVLTTADLVPDAHRSATRLNPAREGLASWDAAWAHDEFVVDPSRLTLDISATGIDGDTFKHEYLMDAHSIQVNKTSRTSVLLMTNIGTSRSAVAYLIEVLIKIAEKLQERSALGLHRGADDAASGIPALPGFSSFAREFQVADGSCGDIHGAFYATYQDRATLFLRTAEVRSALDAGERVVSAGFVTPYPPGFPILVPGQEFTREIIDYMDALDTREIHGYERGRGYRVFDAGWLARQEEVEPALRKDERTHARHP